MKTKPKCRCLKTSLFLIGIFQTQIACTRPEPQSASSASIESKPAIASGCYESSQYAILPYRGVNVSGGEWGMSLVPNSAGMTTFGNTAGTGVNPLAWWPNGYEVDGYGYFRRSGINTIRFPIAWESIQPQLNAPLDATFLSTVRQTVQSMICNGMTVVLDIHNNGGYGSGFAEGNAGANASGLQFTGGMFNVGGEAPNGLVEPTANEFGNLWTQLASDPAFKNNPHVILDLMNEPNASGSNSGWGTLPPGVLLNYYQTAIQQIRETGATNLILLEGDDDADPDFANTSGDELKNIVDSANNFAFEIHAYVDDSGSGATTTCTPGQSQSLDILLQPFVAWSSKFPNKNFQAFLGEFGSDQGPNNTTAACQTNLQLGYQYLFTHVQYFLGFTYWSGGFFAIEDTFRSSNINGGALMTNNAVEAGGIAGGTDSPQITLMKSAGQLVSVSK